MARVLLTSRPVAQRDPRLSASLVGILVLAAAGLALLPLPYNAAAAVGLATAVLTFLRPTWGLYLVLLSVPVQDVGAPRFGDVAITATKVMVPLALAAWAALRLSRGGLHLAPSWLVLPYGLFVAALASSVIAAANQMVALTETARWLQAFGVFLMTLDLVRTRRALAGMVAVLLLGGAAQAGVGLVQSVTGVGPTSFMLTAGLSRAFGTFGMPNSYAGYLEMTFPLALALSIWLAGRILARRADWRPSLARRAAWLAVPGAALVLLAGIGASYSRGAWLGTTVGMIVMVLLAGRRALFGSMAAALIVGIMLWTGGTALLPAEVAGRFDSITESLAYRDVRHMVITPENYAVAERLAMWQAGIAMFQAEPVHGIGAGNFDIVYRRYNVPQFLYSRGHAHNYYIHIAAEAGMIGLAAYLLVLAAAWIDIGRALRRLHDSWLRTLTVGAAGILAAVMTHNIFENLHVLNMNLHLFAALAIPALALRLQAEQKGTP